MVKVTLIKPPEPSPGEKARSSKCRQIRIAQRQQISRQRHEREGERQYSAIELANNKVQQYRGDGDANGLRTRHQTRVNFSQPGMVYPAFDIAGLQNRHRRAEYGEKHNSANRGGSVNFHQGAPVCQVGRHFTSPSRAEPRSVEIYMQLVF